MRTSTNEAHISADTTDIETRLLKVESTQAQDRTEFQTISTRIGTLEANIDTNIATSQENSDRLMAIERADIKLERNRTEIQSAMSVQNTSIQFVMGRLAQLDTDISEEMTNVLLQETKLMQVEANMVVQNASLQTLSSKLENLESQGIIDQDMISNNTARLTGVETNLSETNVNLQVLKSTNQAQATRILELELGANETMNKFEDYGIRLTNATGRAQCFLPFQTDIQS